MTFYKNKYHDFKKYHNNNNNNRYNTKQEKRKHSERTTNQRVNLIRQWRQVLSIREQKKYPLVVPRIVKKLPNKKIIFILFNTEDFIITQYI